MGALWLRTNRWLTWFHRWSGVLLCLLFIAWFASGTVLLFVPFPSLGDRDRLAHSEPVDSSHLTQNPAAVLAKVPGADQLLLVSVAGRPIYLAFAADGKPVAVPGDEGPPSGLFSAAIARMVAERYGATPAQRIDGPLPYDQWIVHQHFDPFRPFYRVRLNDADRTDLYVSARTGQVLQKTRGAERAWNWCGAVLHWIYFTPLRKSWFAWNEVVWWLSLVALLASVAGTWLGIHRFLKTRATGRAGWSPFRGWMRWHHVLGLFASIIVLAWIFSGWLSMDHGRLFSKGAVPADGAARFQGMPLDRVARAVPAGFMDRIGPAAEIRFGAVAGRPFAVARGGQLTSTSVLWLESPDTTPTPEIPASVLIAGLKAAWPRAALVERVSTPAPDFYAVAESLGATAEPFSVGELEPLRVYVDAAAGRLLVVMDPSRRTYAWVFYALHSFNFPALLAHPTTRAILVVVLMIFGLGFSATGAVIGIRRLRRSLAN
ncbi:MAG TPA: PepSY domain-containing protein [Steroidobacteraceae bacterium]|nr:PepSY domain-containing protein [Steroidobacteraceae bacterium]